MRMNEIFRGFNYSLILFLFWGSMAFSAVPNTLEMDPQIILTPPPLPKADTAEKPNRNSEEQANSIYTSVDRGPVFDLPITYNSKVRTWIQFFQKQGQRDFKIWMERSYRYLPKIMPMLEKQGLPKDLAYMAMIESGFSPRAVSTASAVGYWQFMKPTAERYGLKVDWWIDERRDIVKSTLAAANYLNDLYKMFGSWYLAAAAYNMGEGRVKKMIEKYKTRNYWELSRQKDFPRETEQYIPKLIATMLMAKAPKLYGFRDLKPWAQMDYEYFQAPGGTDLENFSRYLGMGTQDLSRLNPELTQGFVPHFFKSYSIRIPKGKLASAKRFANSRLFMSN